MFKGVEKKFNNINKSDDNNIEITIENKDNSNNNNNNISNSININNIKKK